MYIYRLVLLLLIIHLPVSALPLNTIRGNRFEKFFYLTFDAHLDSRNILYILDVLREEGVRATFFLTGRFLDKHPAGARLIAVHGHAVGNHTWSHRRRYSVSLLRRELAKTAALYCTITGRRMLPLWRAPYLQHMGRNWLLRGAARAGYTHIDVSLGARDWVSSRHRDYLSNSRFLDAFGIGLNFKRFRRMVLCGWTVHWYRGSDFDYRGVIMLYHLGQFRRAGLDFVFSLRPLIRLLKANGYRFRTCQDFLPRGAG